MSPVRDGPSCPGCGLPNYEGLCPNCRGDQQAFEEELVPPFESTRAQPADEPRSPHTKAGKYLVDASQREATHAALAAVREALQGATADDGHHPSCCGACDECLGICPAYHGRERRSGSADRRAGALTDDAVLAILDELDPKETP